MAQIFGMARIGRDVEVRYTQAGDPVASVSLAFDYGQKGQDGKRPTQWVDGSLWGKRAESLAPYLIKGSRISVTLDDVHIETFQNREGAQGHKLVGRITALEFGSTPQREAQAAPPPARQQPQQNQYAAQRGGQASAANLADLDDDIPF
ncbi:single-stranded DNA-binding protein [Bordetella bronchiseptica F4563]|uniref:single-stranded DNA-binding protein n=1 Tax=Bordetella bronchiseptica TaxID=518 RepID=UPI000460BAD3|nr:single-stranded DNA-binding protein [Bordetella bronchiseptica]KDC23949.1 single-stranded DNA-binding protein [Bordetella bronchiseptica F4563]